MVVWFGTLLHVLFHMRFGEGRSGWGILILGAKDLKALCIRQYACTSERKGLRSAGLDRELQVKVCKPLKARYDLPEEIAFAVSGLDTDPCASLADKGVGATANREIQHFVRAQLPVKAVSPICQCGSAQAFRDSALVITCVKGIRAMGACTRPASATSR